MDLESRCDAGNERARRSPRTVWLVVGVTLLVRVAFAAQADWPASGDPKYYDDVALALARGEGLTSRCLWNYLFVPDDLPYPACGYWGPVVPWIVACGYALLGPSPRSGQVAMIVVSLLLAWVAVVVARRLTASERLALVTGLLMAVHFRLSYFSVQPDTPAPFALFANLCLLALALGHTGWKWGFFAAIPPALAAQLTRADGVALPALVFVFAGVAVLARRLALKELALLLTLYGACWAPWLARNHQAFGTPFPSSILRSMTLSRYSDIFLYRDRPSPEQYLKQGPAKIARDKLAAVRHNVEVVLSGESRWVLVFLPFALPTLVGSRFAAPFLVYGLFLFGSMSLVFNFQSQRGSLMHSLPALHPFLFASSLIGLERLVDRLREGDLKRFLGRFGPWIPVVWLSAYAVLALAHPDGLRAVKREAATVQVALATWWRTPGVGGPAVRLMTNEPLALVGMAGAPVVMEPWDDDDAVIAEVAQRFRVRYMVYLEFKGDSPRRWGRVSVPAGTRTFTRVEEILLDCPLLDLRRILIFELMPGAPEPSRAPSATPSAPPDFLGDSAARPRPDHRPDSAKQVGDPGPPVRLPGGPDRSTR